VFTPAAEFPGTDASVFRGQRAHGHISTGALWRRARETALAINNAFARDHYVHVHKGKTQTYTNTHWQKHTLAETHPCAHTPAALPPPRPLVLMDGSLITTVTLGLLFPHESPRTCVSV